jgi:hypothetical protein
MNIALGSAVAVSAAANPPQAATDAAYLGQSSSAAQLEQPASEGVLQVGPNFLKINCVA